MSGKLVARTGLACFVSGVILLYQLTALPHPVWLIFLSGLALLLGLVLNSGIWRSLFLSLTFVLAGMTWSAWHAQERLHHQLPASLESTEIEVSGVICDVPEPGNYSSVRFSLCVTQWHGVSVERSDSGLPERLRLAWYGGDATLDMPRRVRLAVVLKRPHGTLNPEGFRYEDWLFRQGYGATGSVREVSEDLSVPCGLVCHYHQWRTHLVNRLVNRLEASKTLPLAVSLVLGHRGYLEPSHWQVLKDTGTIHLVAISGLHLGLVALGAGFLARRLLIWLPERWLSPRRMRWALFILVSAASAAYALAAGFTVPTRRALIMVMVGCWWLLNARQGPATQAVLVALFLVLLMDPFAALDPGFWLSFGAVLSLVALFSSRLGSVGGFKALLLAQFAVFAGLWPLLAMLGQPQPLLGFVANLVAIPWVSLVVMPVLMISALIMAVTSAVDWFLVVPIDWVLGCLWGGLEWIGSFHLSVPRPGIAVLAGFAVVVVLALAVPISLFRLCAGGVAILWMAHLVGVQPSRASNVSVEHPELWLWDVGQGLSLVVRQNDKVLVYDTGPAYPSGYSVAESVLVPNLRALGVKRIDLLIVSHGDNDHAGGIPFLAEQLPVERIISGEPDRLTQKLPTNFTGRVEPCVGGNFVEFPMLSLWKYGVDLDGNDASCVASLTFDEGRQELLLSGDITASAESSYLLFREQNQRGSAPENLVLVAPHHGSKTSSSQAWVEKLRADWVLFSAGYQHRYGHPHPKVVSRYRAVASRAYNTATSGALRLVFGPDGVSLEQSREATRFWIRKPPSRENWKTTDESQ